MAIYEIPQGKWKWTAPELSVNGVPVDNPNLISNYYGMFTFDNLGNIQFVITAVNPPGPTTLGGVFSSAAVAHEWINSINTDGTVGLSQPNFTDIAGIAAVSQGGTGVTSANANTFFAGPTSGGAAPPSFRALTSADLPYKFSSEEVVTISGTTGSLTYSPNGVFFMFSKNGQLLYNGMGYTRVGQTITVAFAPDAGDVFVAWYTY